MNQSKKTSPRPKARIDRFLYRDFSDDGRQVFYAYGQDKSGLPDGFDAVQAAPNSHKVIFENEFVRLYACSKLLFHRRARRNRCTTTDGRVSFLIGIPEVEGRISVITAPTAA